MIFRINKPKELQIKIVRRFAFIPVQLSNGKYVWLQLYYKKKRYESNQYHEEYFSEQALNRLHSGNGNPRTYPLGPVWDVHTYGGYWVTKQRYLKPEEEMKSDWDNYTGDVFNPSIIDNLKVLANRN